MVIYTELWWKGMLFFPGSRHKFLLVSDGSREFYIGMSDEDWKQVLFRDDYWTLIP